MYLSLSSSNFLFYLLFLNTLYIYILRHPPPIFFQYFRLNIPCRPIEAGGEQYLFSSLFCTPLHRFSLLMCECRKLTILSLFVCQFVTQSCKNVEQDCSYKKSRFFILFSFFFFKKNSFAKKNYPHYIVSYGGDHGLLFFFSVAIITPIFEISHFEILIKKCSFSKAQRISQKW